MIQVKKQLAVLSALYKRELSPDLVAFYMDSFEGISEGVVLEALKKCSTEVNRFPTIADIHQRIKSNIPDEQEIVGLIYEAIDLYGYPSPQKAREHIGEIGWRAVLTCGGWMNICSTPADDDTSLRAQLRMAAQSAARRYKEDPEMFTARLPRQTGNKLAPLSDSLKECVAQLEVSNKDYQKDIPF